MFLFFVLRSLLYVVCLKKAGRISFENRAYILPRLLRSRLPRVHEYSLVGGALHPRQAIHSILESRNKFGKRNSSCGNIPVPTGSHAHGSGLSVVFHSFQIHDWLFKPVATCQSETLLFVFFVPFAVKVLSYYLCESVLSSEAGGQLFSSLLIS